MNNQYTKIFMFFNQYCLFFYIFYFLKSMFLLIFLSEYLTSFNNIIFYLTISK